MLRSLALLFTIVLLVAGAANAATFIGQAPAQFVPDSSTSNAVVSGAIFGLLSPREQELYITAVIDTMSAIMGEIRYWEENVRLSPEDLTREPLPEDMVRLLSASTMTATKLLATLSIVSGRDASEVADATRQHLRERPGERHTNAALIVWKAITTAEWK